MEQSLGPQADQERGVGHSEEGVLFVQKLEIWKEVWKLTEVKEEWNKKYFPTNTPKSGIYVTNSWYITEVWDECKKSWVIFLTFFFLLYFCSWKCNRPPREGYSIWKASHKEYKTFFFYANYSTINAWLLSSLIVRLWKRHRAFLSFFPSCIMRNPLASISCYRY